MRDSSIFVVDYDATCAAGRGMAVIEKALESRHSGLRPNDIPHSHLDTWIGKVAEIDDYPWSEQLASWQSRNNALIALALEGSPLRSKLQDFTNRFGSERIGVVLGSSTSSIDRSEQAYRHLDDEQLAPEYIQDKVLNPHAPALFTAHLCALSGPAVTINTACSSSAKVFATAARWLRLGLVDAVLVGGADTLCLSVLHGFHSLQLVSTQPCKPFDRTRDGINLGEAAGFALLVREEHCDAHLGIRLSGYGESSDAHHMSHPHPEGLGAGLAMEVALGRAQLAAEDIGYINLHGTASRANDNIEGNLVARLFPDSTLASSTKGWMGHTLGAAGIMEAIVAMHCLRTGLVPGTLNLEESDPDIALTLQTENTHTRIDNVMSNSFGFGGNNCSLVFSRA